MTKKKSFLVRTKLIITEENFQIHVSDGFLPWMESINTSLAFSTYQSGKIFMIGMNDDRLSVYERTFNRAMGIYATAQTFYMSDICQIWRFENALAHKELHKGYDRLYVPQVGYITGDIDIHDIALSKTNKPIFISTLFNCIAATSMTHSLAPIWTPPFITELAAEDRCHLNGLAMKDGNPKYVSIVAETNRVDEWRKHRVNGGIIMDIETNQVIVRGLSMPHSPRVYKDKLWVINSGTGEFGYIKFLDHGKTIFVPITFCPGYARGLCFIDNYAIIGLSKPRDNSTFQDLPLNDLLTKGNIEAICGLIVVDLNTGELLHCLQLEGVVKEIYDVVTLPGVKRPMLLGFRNKEIFHTITIENTPS